MYLGELINAIYRRVVPAGGSTGQVLKKKSGSDYDTEWGTDQSGGGGGGSLTAGSVDTAELADGAVTTVKIADDAVTSAKLGSGAVDSTALGSGAVTSAKIGNQQVGRAKLTPLAVDTAQLNNSAVTADKLATNAVTSGKIAGSAVTQAKIANGAVGGSQIASGGVGSTELANNAVIEDKIADDAVTQDKIEDGNVSEAKLSEEARARLIPSGGTSGQVLKKDTGTDYDVSWQNDETGGGTPAALWSVAAHPATAVTVASAVPSTQGTWGDWTTLCETTALTSSQTGDCLVISHTHLELDDASTGGGDRVLTEKRLIRYRGTGARSPGADGNAVGDTVLNDNLEYGPRNLPANAANTSQAFADASQITDGETVVHDDAQSGDIYIVQARLLTQRTTVPGNLPAGAPADGHLDATANTTQNDIHVVQLR